MPDVRTYSVFETLKDGTRVEIRALRKEDSRALLAAIDRTSDQSRYRRFFGPKRYFSEEEIHYFTDLDFVNHVALVVEAEENGRPAIVAGGRYIVTGPAEAELAFAVIDSYQGRGIAAILLRHLAAIARKAGLRTLIAEVLPDNTAMLKVFERSGLHPRTKTLSGSIHVSMNLVETPK